MCLCALSRGGVISLWIMKLWSCAFVVKVWARHFWVQPGWLHVLHHISGSFYMIKTVLVGDFRSPMAPGRPPAQNRGFGPPSGTHHSRKENRSSLAIFGLRRPPAQIPGFGPPSETHHSRTENRSSFVIFGLRRPPAQIRGFGPPSGTVIFGLHLPPVGRSLFLKKNTLFHFSHFWPIYTRWSVFQQIVFSMLNLIWWYVVFELGFLDCHFDLLHVILL